MQSLNGIFVIWSLIQCYYKDFSEKKSTFFFYIFGEKACSYRLAKVVLKEHGGVLRNTLPPADNILVRIPSGQKPPLSLYSKITPFDAFEILCI